MENTNIEFAILYVLLTKPEKQPYILQNIKPEYFEDFKNKTIFELALDSQSKGERIEPHLLAQKCDNSQIAFRISEVISDCFVVSPLTGKYCKALFDRHIEKLIKAAKNIDDFNRIKEFQNNFSLEENKILHISSGVENFEKRYEARKEKTIFTCYTALDYSIGSFMGGDYIVLGAATGCGKTSIALNLARQFCMQDKNVLYFSLEMPLEQLQNRFVCMLQGLSSSKYRSFGFNLMEMQKYKEGLSTLNQWNLNVVKDYSLTVDKMRMYIEKQKSKGLDFVILDYLGLMQGFNNKSLYEKTTIISRQIKVMATDYDIPILALVQLNRDLKNRQNKRPILSDIRESGAIEQDADFILFAHRQGIYDSNASPRELDLIIAKNRHGQSNTTLRFDFNLSTQEIKEV